MNRIRDLRVEKDMNQTDLGRLLGCSGTAVSKYELGQRQLDPATINALCDLFECTSDYLLGRSTSRQALITDEDAKLLQAYHAARLKDRQIVDQILAEYMEGAREKSVG